MDGQMERRGTEGDIVLNCVKLFVRINLFGSIHSPANNLPSPRLWAPLFGIKTILFWEFAQVSMLCSVWLLSCWTSGRLTCNLRRHDAYVTLVYRGSLSNCNVTTGFTILYLYILFEINDMDTAADDELMRLLSAIITPTLVHGL